MSGSFQTPLFQVCNMHHTDFSQLGIIIPALIHARMSYVLTLFCRLSTASTWTSAWTGARLAGRMPTRTGPEVAAAPPRTAPRGCSMQRFPSAFPCMCSTMTSPRGKACNKVPVVVIVMQAIRRRKGSCRRLRQCSCKPCGALNQALSYCPSEYNRNIAHRNLLLLIFLL